MVLDESVINCDNAKEQTFQWQGQEGPAPGQERKEGRRRWREQKHKSVVDDQV